MSKSIFSFLFVFAFSLSAMAQDKIFYRNGAVEEAKILEINKDNIAFKKANNPDGPTYRELKIKIEKIVFANGTVENFTLPPNQPISIGPRVVLPSEIPASKPDTFMYKKNIISYSVSDVLFKRATLAYEHIFGKGFLSLKVPVSFGLGSNNIMDVDYLNSYIDDGDGDYYNYNSVPADENRYTSIVRKNTFGLELNAYPFGQKAASFFIGPGFYYGFLEYKYDEIRYILDRSNGFNNYNSVITPKQGKSNSYSGLINTGFVFKAKTNFTVNLQIGLGFRKNNVSFEEYTATIFNPSFQIGYAF
jgi:hypothetical protein